LQSNSAGRRGFINLSAGNVLRLLGQRFVAAMPAA
jgi:hypothetical protein